MKKRIFSILLAFVMTISACSVVMADQKPTSTASARTITVAAVRGDGKSTVTRNGASFGCVPGLRLIEGDSVTTDKDSRLYMNTDRGDALLLDCGSSLTVTKNKNVLTVDLTEGHLFYDVIKNQDGQNVLQFMCNNVTMAVRGTSGLIGVYHGRYEHELYDGVVDVTVGEEKTVTQTAGQYVSISPSPSVSDAEALSVRKFTISEIPSFVVDEIIADKELHEKVISQVPVSVDKNGNEKFITKDDDLRKYGSTLKNSFPLTTAKNEGSSSVSGSGSAPATQPETEPETEPQTEIETETETQTETESQTEPETEPETETSASLVICEGCKDSYDENDAGESAQHKLQVLPCGCTGRLCSSDGHKTVTCVCGDTYCEKDEAAKARHQLIECRHCKETYCKTQDSTKHTTFRSYACDTGRYPTGHGDYACEWTEEKNAMHVSVDCSCGETYCKADEAACAKHQHVCEHCGKTYCPEDEEAARMHTSFIGYECNDTNDPAGHGQWKCLYSEDDETESKKHGWISFECGDHGRFGCEDDSMDLLHGDFKGYACNPKNNKDGHGDYLCSWAEEENEKHVWQNFSCVTDGTCAGGPEHDHGAFLCDQEIDTKRAGHVFIGYDCNPENDPKKHGYWTCCGFDPVEAAKHTWENYICGEPEHGHFKCATDPDASLHVIFKGYDCNPGNDPCEHGDFMCVWTEEKNTAHAWKDFDCVPADKAVGGPGTDHGEYLCSEEYSQKAAGHTWVDYPCGNHGRYKCEADGQNFHKYLFTCDCGTPMYQCYPDFVWFYHTSLECMRDKQLLGVPSGTHEDSDHTHDALQKNDAEDSSDAPSVEMMPADPDIDAVCAEAVEAE